ncbi:MAG: hypothetical protein ACT4PT_00295 [Methanobacteriota archaeon]
MGRLSLRSRSQILVVATLIVVALLPAPAPAIHTALVAEGSSGEYDWVTIRFTTNGTPFELRADLPITTEDPAELGLRLFTLLGHARGGAAATWLGRERPLAVRVDRPAAARVSVLENRTSTPGWLFITVNTAGPAATYHAAFWTAGNGSNLTWRLGGGLGVTLNTTRSGNGSFLYTTPDFASNLSAHLYPAGSGVGARVVHDGPINVTIGNRFIGAFRAAAARASDQMTARFPNVAPLQACPCAWPPTYGAETGRPGTYTFWLNGTATGKYTENLATLSGVDLSFPP